MEQRTAEVARWTGHDPRVVHRVLELARESGALTSGQVRRVLQLEGDRAAVLLEELAEAGLLRRS
jgi:hypothetical protein